MDGIEIVDFNLDEQFDELDSLTPSQIKDRADTELAVVTSDTLPMDNSYVEDVLKKSFTDLLDKNKITNITYKNFKDIISGLADYDTKESEYARLYTGKLVGAITDSAKVKSTVALGFLIDKAINSIMEIASDPKIQSLDMIVSSTREVFDWLDKLDKLKNKYFVAGSDRMMQQLGNSVNKEKEKKLTPEAIANLIEVINSEASKKKE